MKKAIGLYDKLIIYICCLLAYIFQAGSETSISTIFVALIVSCLLSYFDSSKAILLLTMCFLISTFLIPSLVFFMPLIIFDTILDKYKYMRLLSIIPLIELVRERELQAFLLVLILLILSVLLANRVDLIKRMDHKHRNLIDTARELSFKLEKQNKDLIEKQDNELYTAALNERNRIAREIHDNVGHLLSSSILQVGALKVVNKDEAIDNSINILNETLNKAMDSIRESVHDLYDEAIDLNASICELIENFNFCKVEFKYNISSKPDKKLKYAFVAIIKEALTNIAKHSNATHANIIVTEHPALYQLVIRDNGQTSSCHSENGLGLKNMADRVNALNGNLNIKTEQGFEIFITVPRESEG